MESRSGSAAATPIPRNIVRRERCFLVMNIAPPPALLSYPSYFKLVSMDLQLREIALADAAVVAELSGELGYPASPEVMQQRIASLSPDHVVYVACLAGEVAGWIDVSVTHHLQSEPRAEIGGLVVAS